MGVGEASAAALVSLRLPDGIDHILAVAEDAGVHFIVAVIGAGTTIGGWEAEGLNMARGETNCEKGFCWVEGSCEDVSLKR